MGKEKPTSKLCKHCKVEIPINAKICPYCRKKQGGVLKWMIIIFIVIGVIGSVSGNSDDSETHQSNNIDMQENVNENKKEEEEEIIETDIEFNNAEDAFKQGFEDNLEISDENKENIDSISENINEIATDEEVEAAYEKWKESVTNLFKGSN